VKRRDFITLLGGAASGWPCVARAQQGERLRRIEILMPYPPSDTEWQSRVGALRQELQRLGWTRGANIVFDERWTTDNMDLVRANAASLVESNPDIIVALGGRVIPILMQMTRSIPIVIPGASDPVGARYVENLARPGGNVTGFGLFDFSVIGKTLVVRI
jgi:putative ABC transport system substrate-binding protein